MKSITEGGIMRIVIVGGGIAAVYLANSIKRQRPETDVLIISKEEFKPYDRIHLCALVDGSAKVDDHRYPGQTGLFRIGLLRL